MIEAVIIDLDDTLCLTEEACFDMENEILLAMGRPLMKREAHRANWGKPLFEAITERSPGIDVGSFRLAYEPIIQRYTEEGNLDNILQVNLQALGMLASADKQLFVLTSRTHTELKHLLKPAHSLASHIEAFYYRDNMEFHKPDPRAFQIIEREHGFVPSKCVYVGDSLSDAEASKKAGLYFIASLESGLRTQADFETAGYRPDLYINKFSEVVAAVQQLDTMSA